MRSGSYIRNLNHIIIGIPTSLVIGCNICYLEIKYTSGILSYSSYAIIMRGIVTISILLICILIKVIIHRNRKHQIYHL